jgi:YesN/AraC family two-component response regulator
MKLKEAAVLFVEDEPLLRESMGAWLARKTGRCICAQHGAEALEILAANRIDLLLSDIRMPVMDGIALVKKIRKTGLKPRVILVTGFKDTVAGDAYELGVDAIVEKPFDRGQLLRTMQHCLEEVRGLGK